MRTTWSNTALYKHIGEALKRMSLSQPILSKDRPRSCYALSKYRHHPKFDLFKNPLFRTLRVLKVFHAQIPMTTTIKNCLQASCFPEYAHSISWDITVKFSSASQRCNSGDEAIIAKCCKEVQEMRGFSNWSQLSEGALTLYVNLIYILFLQLQLIRLFAIQKIDNILHRLSPKRLSYKIHETRRIMMS